jgi:peroxiredoxin
MEYRYPHFKRQLLAEDSAFERGPSPGEPMPDFELATTDGGRVSKNAFVGERPLLLVFSSYT